MTSDLWLVAALLVGGAEISEVRIEPEGKRAIFTVSSTVLDLDRMANSYFDGSLKVSAIDLMSQIKKLKARIFGMQHK